MLREEVGGLGIQEAGTGPVIMQPGKVLFSTFIPGTRVQVYHWTATNYTVHMYITGQLLIIQLVAHKMYRRKKYKCTDEMN